MAAVTPHSHCTPLVPQPDMTLCIMVHCGHCRILASILQLCEGVFCQVKHVQIAADSTSNVPPDLQSCVGFENIAVDKGKASLDVCCRLCTVAMMHKACAIKHCCMLLDKACNCCRKHQCVGTKCMRFLQRLKLTELPTALYMQRSIMLCRNCKMPLTSVCLRQISTMHA